MKITTASMIVALSAAGPLVAQSRDLFPVGSNRVDFEVDGLYSGDIDITSSRVAFEQTRGSWNFRGRVGLTHHEIEYTPTFVTLPTTRTETALNYDLRVEKTLSNEWSLTGSIGYGDGYSDHRSIWISEFYDQSFGFNPAYEEADPGFFSASVGVQWNYDPGRSFVSLTLSQAETEIVPGWQIRFDELTGRGFLFSSDDSLRTQSGTFLWNTAINPRLRFQQTVRVGRTDTRQIRTLVQGELAYAMTDDLTCRFQAGWTHEDPTLTARYGGITLVYDFLQQWQATLSYRYYEDTGEVNTSNFNTAAPGVITREVATGIRWTNGDLSILASVGLYETDYENVAGSGNIFFAGLFQDRSFTAARLAVTYEF